MKFLLFTWLGLLISFGICFPFSAAISFHVEPDTQYIQTKDSGSLLIWLEGIENEGEAFEFFVNVSTNNEHVIEISQKVLVVGSTETEILFQTDLPGNALINFEQIIKCTPDQKETSVVDVADTYVHVYVIRSHPLDVFNTVIGWVYFTSWSLSFYPQLYENIYRKSVVGLNFDYLSFNMLGYFVYSIFNVGLYWVTYIREQYIEQHPGQLIPVKLNDVFFSLHGGLLTAITIGTCFIYDRGNQRVSWVCRIAIAIGLLYIGTLALLAGLTGVCPNLTWLNFVSWISYIKLIVTIVKYCPQAYMNYSRKSTSGWSIGNVLLDLTGGLCSILQTVLLAYNSNDWPSLYANPVKLGLGILTLIFDSVFMLQHYTLYPESHENSISGRFSKWSKRGYTRLLGYDFDRKKERAGSRLFLN